MKFKIAPSFLLMIIFLFSPTITKNFFLICPFVLFHEFSHVLIAKLFGLNTEQITFGITGAKADIINFNMLGGKKKFAVLIAGPLSNLFLAIAFKSALQNENCMRVNFLLAIFNLLPIYPLDGGQIFIVVLKKIFGSRANRLFIKFNRIMVFIMFFVGLAQFFLFWPNFSLLIISIYIWAVNKYAFVDLVYNLYFR